MFLNGVCRHELNGWAKHEIILFLNGVCRHELTAILWLSPRLGSRLFVMTLVLKNSFFTCSKVLAITGTIKS